MRPIVHLAACIGGLAGGFLLGTVVSDGLIADSRATVVQSTPAAQNAPDLTVQVIGAPQSGSSASVWSTAIGGLIGVGGSVSAQVVAGRFSRSHRRDDRKLDRIDAMLEALHELDELYAADMESDTGRQDTPKLVAAERQFTRAVDLVPSKDLRAAALHCQAMMRLYALMRLEEDELDRPTAQDIEVAQAKMIAEVKVVTSRMK